MPRRNRLRKRRCIVCGHEEPAHFETCKIAKALAFSDSIKHVYALTTRLKEPALSLIVDNTKDQTNAEN